MAQINLLPWREAYRQERKKEFLIQLAGVVVITGLICFLWLSSAKAAVEKQNTRNNILDQEIKQLSKQVEEIEELKQERKELLDRMQVIQDLEGKRSIIVHYFDELAKAIPDGVFLKQIKRQGDLMTIEGISESNNRISAFMRQLNASTWFTSPNLKNVVAAPEFGDQSGEFTMEIITTLPESEEADNG